MVRLKLGFFFGQQSRAQCVTHFSISNRNYDCVFTTTPAYEHEIDTASKAVRKRIIKEAKANGYLHGYSFKDITLIEHGNYLAGIKTKEGLTGYIDEGDLLGAL